VEKKSWINKLDEMEGDEPRKTRNPKRRQFDFKLPPEHLYPYIAAGVGAFLLILLVIVFTRGGDETVPGQDLREVSSRLEALEERIQRFEDREEERQKAFAEFLDSSQDVTRELEMHRENIDDMRQKLAALEGKTRQQEPRTVTAAPVREQRPAAEENGKVYHEVQPGENLFRIGLKYEVSVDRIRSLNNLDPNDSIYPGQNLLIRE